LRKPAESQSCSAQGLLCDLWWGRELSAEGVKLNVEVAADGLAKSDAHYLVESISEVHPVTAGIEQGLTGTILLKKV
jgi:hypothetical protein